MINLVLYYFFFLIVVEFLKYLDIFIGESILRKLLHCCFHWNFWDGNINLFMIFSLKESTIKTSCHLQYIYNYNEIRNWEMSMVFIHGLHSEHTMWQANIHRIQSLKVDITCSSIIYLYSIFPFFCFYCIPCWPKDLQQTTLRWAKSFTIRDYHNSKIYKQRCFEL